MDREHKALALAVVGVVLLFGVVYASSVYWEASGGTEFEAVDGPAITLQEDRGIYVADPFPDNETVDLGNVTFTSTNLNTDGKINANVSGIDDEWIKLTDIQGSTDVYLTVNRSGQRSFSIRPTALLGNSQSNTAEVVKAKQINLNSTDPEFVFGDGTASVILNGLEPNTAYTIEYNDSEKEIRGTGSSTSILFPAEQNNKATVREATPPQPSNPYPVNNEQIDDSTVDLQFELIHEDMDAGIYNGVDIDWKVNGTTIKTTTTNTEGLKSIQTDQFGPGKNTWSAVITDNAGQTATVNGSFGTPTELEIRSEQNPGSLVTSAATVNVTFYGDDGSTETRTTTNGIIDMDGLPLDTPFTVQVEADGYITRQSYVESVIERETIYLLEDTTTAVESNFVVDDPTGEFSPQNSRVFVKKPITRNGTTTYQTVVADIAGFSGFSTTLEQDQRYLLEVKNIDTGEVRQVGPYVARVSETVRLKIDQLDFEFASDDNSVPYDWSFDVINSTDGAAVDVAFGATERIDKLDVVVHKRGNESLVVLNRSFRNYNGTINVRRIIPDTVENPEDKAWVVDWSGSVGGDNVGGSELAGRDLAISPSGMPQDILSIVGIFLIMIVGGLFSAANLTVGAIVVALVSGALWTVGVIPPGVSGLFIAVALAVGVMFHARRGPQPPR
jgi:hypothetical protein